jgi:hypothetical protein
MSSNRLMYDKCAYKKNLSESIFPGDYALYSGKFQHTAKCRIELGQNSGRESNFSGLGVSIPNGNLVDLESDLRGQTRKNTHCQSEKFQPNCSKCKNCAAGIPCGCSLCKPSMKHQANCQITNYKKRNNFTLPKLHTRKK